MKQMVREGMAAGGIGFSSSPRGGPAIHAGTPSTLASQEEMAALANIAGEYGGCFQFNGFGNLLKPESGFPELVEKINVPMIGNEFRVRPGERADGERAIDLMKGGGETGQGHLWRGHSLLAHPALRHRRLLHPGRTAPLGRDQGEPRRVGAHPQGSGGAPEGWMNSGARTPASPRTSSGWVGAARTSTSCSARTSSPVKDRTSPRSPRPAASPRWMRSSIPGSRTGWRRSSTTRVSPTGTWTFWPT